MTDTALVPGSFVGELVLRHVKGREYVADRDFGYFTRAGLLIVVPAGFSTDGGSVPAPGRVLYAPYGSDCDEAYVVHDYLYAHAERFTGDDRGHISRGACDRIMLEIMEVKGFRASGRRTIYAFVRAGGWHAWRKHRGARARDARE